MMRCYSLLLATLALTSFAGETPIAPLGPPDTLFGKRVDGWVEHLRSYESEKERKLALFCISEFGPLAAAAVPELKVLLKEELQPSIPLLAAETLGAIGPNASAAVPDLLAIYNDKRRPLNFKAEALHALSRIDPAQSNVRKAYLSALKSEDAELRHAALDAAVLFAAVEQNTLAMLSKALANPEDAPIAARTLSLLGPSGVNVLVKSLDLPDAAARQAIANTLAALGGDAAEAVPSLLRLAAKERDPATGKALTDAAVRIAPLSPPSLNILAQRIATGTDFVPAAAEDTTPYKEETRLLVLGGNSSVHAITLNLRTPHAAARKLFVTVLSQIKDPQREVFDALITLAQDKDNDVGLAAIKALDAFGPQAAAAKPALEDIAKADAVLKRPALLAAMNVSRDASAPRFRSTLDGKSVDEALAALKSADAHERKDAAEGLRSRAEKQNEIAAALIDALKDADADVRIAAARSLTQYGQFSAPALPTITEWLQAASNAEKKPDRQTISLAAAALAAIAGMGDGAKPALNAIVALALSPAADGEKDLTRVLGLCLRIIGTDSVPPLVAQFKAEDAKVRERAARVIGQMGPVGATAVPDLLQLSNSAIDSDAQASFAALESMGPIAYPLAARPLLDAVVGDVFVERRKWAVQTLGGIGIPKEGDKQKVLETLQHALLDPDETVCRAAHGAMVRIGPPALPYLKEMLDIGEGAASYWWAVRALARLKAEPNRVVPLLIDLTRPGVRMVKAGAFAEQGVAAELLINYAPDHPEMIPALLRCLGEREEFVANAAIRTLRPFGSSVLASIRPLLRDPNPRMRAGALKALSTLQFPDE